MPGFYLVCKTKWIFKPWGFFKKSQCKIVSCANFLNVAHILKTHSATAKEDWCTK